MRFLLPVSRTSDKSVSPQLLDQQELQTCARPTCELGAGIKSSLATRLSAAIVARLSLALLILPTASYVRAATLAPTSLSWSSVNVGLKGGPKPVTLTNNSAATISISGVAISGTNAGDFVIYTNTCGTTLAASSSCSATILFAPTTTGSRTASLMFTDGAGTQSAGLSGLGTGSSGMVSVSPTSLSWGSVAVGGVGGTNVATLHNGSATSISISSVAVTGTNAADFAISSKTCGATLASGANCTATISFSPKATGTRSASLQFSDGASNSPQAVSLSGTGTSNSSGTASVSPTSLNWASVAVGQTGGAKPITLTNNGTSSIAISSIIVGGTNSSDFLISTKTCGASLAAGASCSATILFRPTVAGSRSANVTFSDGASGSPQIVGLTGLGTGGSTGASVNPASISFGSQTLNSSSAAMTATLTNNSTSAIAIGSVGLSGANPGEFSISAKTCGASLAASASCTASVVFKPTVAGSRTATLVFTDGASNSPQAVSLSGTGSNGTSGSASVSPTSLNWVSVAVGQTGGAKAITLTNNGTSSMAISSIVVGGTNSTDFLISTKTCGASLAAGASCSASILFRPTVAGSRSANVTFSDGASNSPQIVGLTGLGTGGSTGVSVNPTSMSFASQTLNSSSAAMTATLTNSSTSAIAISSVGLSGANPGEFSISAKTCGASLAASASCTASVVFKPTVAGSRTATLVFTDGASNSPQTVSLSGTGVTTLTISPLTPTVAPSGTIAFSASAAATWTASCGTINSSGLFTAPATTGSCTVTATATGGSGQKASTLVTVSSTGALTVTPSSAPVHALGTQQFTANKSVTWSASCGSINSSGLFTAPATAGTCTITATLSGGGGTGTASAAVSLVNYATRKNTNSGTGLQSNELALTPASVSSGKFAQRWSASVDGGVWGQPLYINAITIGGKARNALFVTTSNDSVYAIDADTGAQLWKTSFLSTGVTPVLGTYTGISSTTGILSTPVIDVGSKLLYVVATTAENNGTYFPHRLHALDLVTGKEMLGGPVLISHPHLPTLYKFQRPGLLLANNMVYVGFGSIKDITPYHGLLFAFDKDSLEQNAVFDVTPTGGQGGLWMSGAAPTSDSSGNIYISTGNGTVSTNNFGMSIVKLSPMLQVLDYFIPFDYATLNAGDSDFGSGDVMVVPDQNGPIPHLLIACGKATPIYVLNRDSMGRLSPSSDNIVQRLDHQLGNRGNWRDSGEACYNEPGMWKQNVYYAANHDVMKMFVLDASTGKLSSTPVSTGTYTYLWPGADPVISSNGNSDGIVWTVDYGTSTLHANDATDVSKALYTSPSLGVVVRWIPPVVANGHVYVALQGKVIAFALAP